MTLHRIAAAVVAACAFAATESPAATLEIVAGDHPQHARQGAYFRDPIVLQARGDDGLPLAGALVIAFEDAYRARDSFVGFSGDNGSRYATDAQGIVTMDNIVGGPIDGSTRVTAYLYPADESAALAQVTLPPLTTNGQGAAVIEIVSGDGQAAAAGDPYAARWIVRAVDRHGHGVPYAQVFFDNFEQAHPTVFFSGGPGVVVNGASGALAMADAEGYAVSPIPVAGAERGAFFASACGMMTGTDCATFRYEID